jgi:hypothetical protein
MAIDRHGIRSGVDGKAGKQALPTTPLDTPLGYPLGEVVVRGIATFTIVKKRGFPPIYRERSFLWRSGL